ncbi:MAG TPA: nicotinate-nucleotide adenylyltransferase [Caldimonas sp.]|nr:nicotinate-nucleotide adenylyltransferase [Caldimonas sp.]
MGRRDRRQQRSAARAATCRAEVAGAGFDIDIGGAGGGPGAGLGLGESVMRVGLFGGSFDPVHNAHVALARTALEQLGLDELRWIPVGRPWQKARRLASGADREAMVRLAIAGEPRFVLDRSELRRRGVSFTLDTVRELAAARPDDERILVIGQDQYASLHTWRDWKELLGAVTLAVANRPGAGLAINPQIAAVAHRPVMLPMMDISSTEIRRRVAAGEPIAGLVPPAVASYIEQHRLYRDGGDPTRS